MPILGFAGKCPWHQPSPQTITNSVFVITKIIIYNIHPIFSSQELLNLLDLSMNNDVIKDNLAQSELRVSELKLKLVEVENEAQSRHVQQKNSENLNYLYSV